MRGERRGDRSRGRGRRAVARPSSPCAPQPARLPAGRGLETETPKKERKRSERCGLRDAGRRRRQHAKRANEHMRAGSCRPWLP
ncbi:unnamed protein product [Arctia plantaginis]|uniref:Uncharacterized protein n=1 Tax=Arctia plantaginis TaxID=874455 RepID=A0A8S1BBU6_ARCPL|nr:unnamed protein product [Arctia plantaginis]CAB3257041.1 unnamed protein product [Arctia plantaginis]